jgi:hypothetical protein
MQFMLIVWPKSKPGVNYAILPIDRCLSEPIPWTCVKVKEGSKEHLGLLKKIGKIFLILFIF